ncbi:MAG TPA: Fe-S cluster assembly scaffold protein NifU [Patescibacteria group bacterium]
MQKYSKKVIEHFTRPHNQGKMKNADGVGTVGNPKCGDIMRMYIKIAKNKQGEEVIKDIKFETLGCGAAISTSSMATDLAKGMTVEEALKITNKQVAEELGGLPTAKMHCSNLAADALHKAIENYRKAK